MNRLFKGSLQNKILIPFVVLVVLTGLTVAFISYFLNINNATSELSKNVEDQMVRLNDTFNLFFENTSSTLERFSLNDMLKNDAVENRNEITESFQATVDTASSMAAIYTGTPDGDLIMYPTPDLDDDFDVRERSWFQDATQGEGEVIWTEPYIDAATGQMIVSAAKAYYNGNELAGVVGTDVYVNTLIEMTDQIEIGETGYAVVFDTEGNYLAHPDETFIGEQAEHFDAIAAAGTQGLIEVESRGEEQIVGFAKNETTGWAVGGFVNVKDFEKQASAIILPTFLSLLTILIIAIVISFVVAKKIVTPIHTVMERMQHIASGNLSLSPLQTNSRDEIGQLVTATNEMSEGMRNLILKIGTASKRVIQQTDEIAHAATEVKAGTEQVSATMQELASGSETEANNTNELSGTMQELTESIADINNYSDEMNNSSTEVLQITEEGGRLMDASRQQMNQIDHIVKDAVTKMEGLDEQTKQVSSLVTVIQDVADQTNLLALNASIEAARAGEQGKGFAVVANEVKKLAEQVSASITDITEIVSTIQTESSIVATSLQGGYQEVVDGTAQIEETSEKFDDIHQAITNMVTNIHSVSSSVGTIAEGSEQMSTSIEEIAAVTEESAAGVEETSASAEQISASMQEVSASLSDLSKVADDLNETVREFRV